jgi:hypothetical protein
MFFGWALLVGICGPVHRVILSTFGRLCCCCWFSWGWSWCYLGFGLGVRCCWGLGRRWIRGRSFSGRTCLTFGRFCLLLGCLRCLGCGRCCFLVMGRLSRLRCPFRLYSRSFFSENRWRSWPWLWRRWYCKLD